MSQEWHAKGSDCCSPLNLCCLSWWCPCFTYGRSSHRLHKNGQLQGFSACNMDCCAWYCLANVGCQWILQMMSRSEMRRKYNLKGDSFKDCLCACCCTPCDLMQQEKEAEYRENLLAQGGVNSVQPLKTESGMVYQPQQQPSPAPQFHSQTGSPPPQFHQQATPPALQYQQQPQYPQQPHPQQPVYHQ